MLDRIKDGSFREVFSDNILHAFKFGIGTRLRSYPLLKRECVLACLRHEGFSVIQSLRLLDRKEKRRHNPSSICRWNVRAPSITADDKESEEFTRAGMCSHYAVQGSQTVLPRLIYNRTYPYSLNSASRWVVAACWRPSDGRWGRQPRLSCLINVSYPLKACTSRSMGLRQHSQLSR